MIFEAVVKKLHWDTPDTGPFADLAIAAGVIGSVLFHHLASKASDELLDRSEARVRELEKVREWRTLDSGQIDRIAEKLRQFHGTRYDAAISAKEPEILKLFESIHSALEKAKWVGYPWGAKSQQERYCGMLIGVGLPLSDVAVGVHTTQWRYCGLQEVTQSLTDELTAAGIPNVRIRQFADQFGTSEGMSFSVAAIHILIGRRT